MTRAVTWSICTIAAAVSLDVALAEPVQRSKPLNLAEFTRTAQPQRQKPAPKSEVAAKPETATKPEPAAKSLTEAPLFTGSVDKKEAAAPTQESDVARFCSNITDQALDARVAWQQKELEATEVKLKQRIAELEAKRAEYEEWLKLREDFLKKAEENVVEIYSRMNPEAAAQQIASMADDTAAAVLAKLKVRVASSILNEMEPARGAHLADTLAGMRRTDDGKPRK
ncbi:MotE family protein [Tardiphaga sp.]|jgi:flagellar motility protein MotE (MotC chaperone)|uniref:MotE family protein n=1 Tax=Tardiphaga sp. TaxID=1926292 RepID=UPI0037DA038F